MKNCFLIVNYNDYKSTKHLIDNINNFECLSEIVVVDNSSSEEEIDLLSKLNGEKINIIFNDSNLGYSGAINIGARYLIDKYKKCNIIVSNSDIVILSEQDLVKLIDTLNDPKIGLVGPQILEKGNILRGRKDCTVNYDIFNNLPVFRHFFNNSDYSENHYINSFSLVDVISTCFFLISSETLQKINYMDENVFLYYEDYIMCNKIRNLGLDIVICNDVKIKHIFSVSVDKNYKNVSKKIMLRDSMMYYHSTYHDINFFQKRLLKLSSYIDILMSKKR
ncbi:MAG: glycosyltransferase family 2 protein [Erysipelotrichales bacterium]|nr:glycosyltransferase family 2 protein [Erysipelotrichales bacterium]